MPAPLLFHRALANACQAFARGPSGAAGQGASAVHAHCLTLATRLNLQKHTDTESFRARPRRAPDAAWARHNRTILEERWAILT
jgi:hypothetical protein